jgi:hypothetical protein
MRVPARPKPAVKKAAARKTGAKRSVKPKYISNRYNLMTEEEANEVARQFRKKFA